MPNLDLSDIDGTLEKVQKIIDVFESNPDSSQEEIKDKLESTVKPGSREVSDVESIGTLFGNPIHKTDNPGGIPRGFRAPKGPDKTDDVSKKAKEVLDYFTSSQHHFPIGSQVEFTSNGVRYMARAEVHSNAPYGITVYPEEGSIPGQASHGSIYSGNHEYTEKILADKKIDPVTLEYQQPLQVKWQNLGGFTRIPIDRITLDGKGRTKRTHEGIDMMAPAGTPVYPIAPGKVTKTSYDGGDHVGGGTTVTIQHPNGLVSYYAHLSSIAPGIQSGAEVDYDTVIGNVGNTGNAHSGGPHLHFGLLAGGTYIDPSYLLSSSPSKGKRSVASLIHNIKKLSEAFSKSNARFE